MKDVVQIRAVWYCLSNHIWKAEYWSGHTRKNAFAVSFIKSYMKAYSYFHLQIYKRMYM